VIPHWTRVARCRQPSTCPVRGSERILCDFPDKRDTLLADETIEPLASSRQINAAAFQFLTKSGPDTNCYLTGYRTLSDRKGQTIARTAVS